MIRMPRMPRMPRAAISRERPILTESLSGGGAALRGAGQSACLLSPSVFLWAVCLWETNVIRNETKKQSLGNLFPSDCLDTNSSGRTNHSTPVASGNSDVFPPRQLVEEVERGLNDRLNEPDP